MHDQFCLNFLVCVKDQCSFQSLFCICISTFFSGFSFSTELILQLCQKLVVHLCVHVSLWTLLCFIDPSVYLDTTKIWISGAYDEPKIMRC